MAGSCQIPPADGLPGSSRGRTFADAVAAAIPQTKGRMALDDGRLAVGYADLAATVAEEGDWLACHGERFALLADNGIGWAIVSIDTT